MWFYVCDKNTDENLADVKCTSGKEKVKRQEVVKKLNIENLTIGDSFKEAKDNHNYSNNMASVLLDSVENSVWHAFDFLALEGDGTAQKSKLKVSYHDVIY